MRLLFVVSIEGNTEGVFPSLDSAVKAIRSWGNEPQPLRALQPHCLTHGDYVIAMTTYRGHYLHLMPPITEFIHNATDQVRHTLL